MKREFNIPKNKTIKFSIVSSEFMSSKNINSPLKMKKNKINMNIYNSANLNKGNSIKDSPKTNIERIMERLKEIAKEFKELGKPEFVEKTNWIITEISLNKMYKFDESLREFEFLKNYYPETLSINGRSQSSKSINKNEITIKKCKSIVAKEIETGISRGQTIKSENSNSLFEKSYFSFEDKLLEPLDIKTFGVNFDVFSYGEKIGRKNLVKQIALSAFTYKDIHFLLNSNKLIDNLEEVRLGYSSEPNAFYHNVSFLRFFNIFIKGLPRN